MKLINILCGQNAECFNVKIGDVYNRHCASKDEDIIK
jgi:hypothetical protein